MKVTEDNYKKGLPVKISDDSKFLSQGHEKNDTTKPKMIGQLMNLSTSDKGWVSVKWSNGKTYEYRVGAESNYDLVYFDDLYDDLNSVL